MKNKIQYNLDCKELNKINEYLLEINSLKISRVIIKAEEKYIFQSFNIEYKCDLEKISIEKFLLDVLTSWPLGIDMKIYQSLISDNEEKILQQWNIKKARINSINFGTFNNKERKIIVEFIPKEIGLESFIN